MATDDVGHGSTPISMSAMIDGKSRRPTDLPGGRLLQGRKGVGKLAGFGIADILEVQTVHKDPDPKVKEQTLIWFKLDLSQLKRVKRGTCTGRGDLCSVQSGKSPVEARGQGNDGDVKAISPTKSSEFRPFSS